MSPQVTVATLLVGGAARLLELPAHGFRTIVADPPWDYRDGLGRGANYTKRGAEAHYALLTADGVVSLPVGRLAYVNAHLYLWTTNAFMVQAHGVAASWGFEVKTILTWVKKGIGMGHHFRNNTEHVLFGTRGTLALRRRDVPTAFHAPRRAHSEKPLEFFALVESVSPGPYLELFGRHARPGWTVWGNEAGKLASQLMLVKP